MKFLLRFLFAILLANIVVSCDKSDTPLPNPEKADITLLVYMAADNTLRDLALGYGTLLGDYKEIIEGVSLTNDANFNLFIYMDTGTVPRLVKVSQKNGKVIEEIIKTYESRNSVGVEETKEVFRDVFDNVAFQAKHYGLVYWSHGDAWTPYPLPSSRWVGQDVSSGDNRMNTDDFCKILKEGPHFDFILGDFCFGSSIEFVYEIRNYTDYFIGSPTEVPGPGAQYDVLVPVMLASECSAVNIAQSYFDTYNALYDDGIGNSNEKWTGGVSICAIKTDALSNLASTTKQLWSKKGTNELRSLVFDYDKRNKSHVGYYDMVGIAEQLTDKADFELWKQAYDAAVVLWKTTQGNFSSAVGMFSMQKTNGVSHYIPKVISSSVTSTPMDKAYRLTSWYKDAGLSDLDW